MHPLLNRLSNILLDGLSGREALLVFLSYNERGVDPLIYEKYTLEELRMAAYDKIYTGLEREAKVLELTSLLLPTTTRGGNI